MTDFVFLNTFLQGTSGGILVQLILSAISLFVAARFLSGVHLDDFTQAGILAVILSVLNATLGSFLDMFNIFSFSLIGFVIDAVVILVASYFMKGFRVLSFWWALGLAFIVSLCNSLLYSVLF